MKMINMKKNYLRKICVSLLAFALVIVVVIPSYVLAGSDWVVSRSKTATQLEKQNDGTYTSDVTLSLPSAVEVLESDVVFVLDESDCYETVYQNMWALMEKFNEACEKDANTKINVGLVFFRGCALIAWDLQEYVPQDYETFKSAVEAAKGNMIYKGSNLASGLYAAKDMLDASDTPKSRQHMILISDGATYVYTHDEDSTTHYSRSAGWGGHYIEWEIKYGSPTAYPQSFKNGGDAADWAAFLSDIKTRRTKLDYENDIDKEYIRTTTGETVNIENALPEGMKYSDFVINVEEALYQSANVYQEIVDSGVNCYAYYPYEMGVFSSFMNYLGGLGEGGDDDFSWITDSVIYLLDKGSTVEDVIGLGVDDLGNDYNFDFVNDAEKLTMNVGGVSYASTKIQENHYVFGEYDKETQEYPYELIYHPAQGSNQEYFEWKFNVKVSNFERAQLTYQVKLTNPQTKPETYTGLFTNQKATLHAVATDGRTTDVDFEKPEVFYKVVSKNPKTGDGNIVFWTLLAFISCSVALVVSLRKPIFLKIK